MATTDALCCSICQAWLHRYCAGIPMSRFTIIATSFVCSACSITASSSIVAELRSEIAALKAEVSELRSALTSGNEKLEKELAESRAASQNAISNTIGGRAARPRPEAQQRRSNDRRAQVPGRPRHDPRPTRTHQAASGPTIYKHMGKN